MNDIGNVITMQLVCNLLPVAKGWVNIFEFWSIKYGKKINFFVASASAQVPLKFRHENVTVFIPPCSNHYSNIFGVYCTSKVFNTFLVLKLFKSIGS